MDVMKDFRTVCPGSVRVYIEKKIETAATFSNDPRFVHETRYGYYRGLTFRKDRNASKRSANEENLLSNPANWQHFHLRHA